MSSNDSLVKTRVESNDAILKQSIGEMQTIIETKFVEMTSGNEFLGGVIQKVVDEVKDKFDKHGVLRTQFDSVVEMLNEHERHIRASQHTAHVRGSDAPTVQEPVPGGYRGPLGPMQGYSSGPLPGLTSSPAGQGERAPAEPMGKGRGSPERRYEEYHSHAAPRGRVDGEFPAPLLQPGRTPSGLAYAGMSYSSEPAPARDIGPMGQSPHIFKCRTDPE